jgi:hypothetical protein
MAHYWNNLMTVHAGYMHTVPIVVRICQCGQWEQYDHEKHEWAHKHMGDPACKEKELMDRSRR